MTDNEAKMRFLKIYDLQNGNGYKLPVVEDKKNKNILICVGVIFFIILVI